MSRTVAILVVTAAALGTPVVAGAATTDGTYTGSARSTDGGTTYGKASFSVKKRKLVTWAVEKVPQQCQSTEFMNYGFTVASNVLKAYGLKSKDVRVSSKGRLKFTYRQPNHLDTIAVDVKFTKKKATGSVIQTAGPGELSTQNCSGSARFTMKK